MNALPSPDEAWKIKEVRSGKDGLEVDFQRPENVPTPPDHDPVNHPRHYTYYQGLEIIDLTEQMNFNKGNAVKYIARAGIKNPDTEVEDLEKAAWYIAREIERIQQRP